MDTETITRIVDTLFPKHPRMTIEYDSQNDEDTNLISKEELLLAIRSLKAKKAPGPDGLPAEILKAVATCNPDLLLNMYNSCLKNGAFYSKWKEARLVLISKGKGSADQPSSYRPLCMLDSSGKLLETMLRPRIQQTVKNAGDLAERQYGFRKGRSTIDVVKEVVSAKSIERGNHYSRPIYLLVTFDVKNAFNSIRWEDAINAMKNDFHFSNYLLRIMRNYLKDRFLIYNTQDGLKRRQLSSGMAQGSVLGADIWNITYDGILRINMPEGTFLNGYADDIAAIIIARDLEKAQIR